MRVMSPLPPPHGTSSASVLMLKGPWRWTQPRWKPCQLCSAPGSISPGHLQLPGRQHRHRGELDFTPTRGW